MKTITGTHTITEMLKNGVPKGSVLYLSRKGGKVKSLEALSASCHGVIVKKVDSLEKFSADSHGAVLLLNEKENSELKQKIESYKLVLKDVKISIQNEEITFICILKEKHMTS